MAYNTVIFDLDGTLVDSAPGILHSLHAACFEVGVPTIVPLDAQLIGPPLQQVLRTVVGEQPKKVIDQLTCAFKKHYDNTGFLKTEAFPNVEAMLMSLAVHGCTMYVATNKRQIPTTRIVRKLAWEHFFKHVYSLDSLASNIATKADLISHVVCTHKLRRRSTVYVGDRDDDGIAARTARIPFILAAWGYGCNRD